jgi:hypothetical protein
MFMKLVKEHKWSVDKALTLKQVECFIKNNKHMFKSFGGDIDNLVTKCKMAHAIRILSQKKPKKHVITLQDMEEAIRLMKPNSLDDEKHEESMLRMYV